MRFAKSTLALAALLPAVSALRTETAALTVDAKGDLQAGRDALDLAERAKSLTAPENVDAALLDGNDAFKDQTCCSKWCCRNTRYSRERVLTDLTFISTEKQLEDYRAEVTDAAADARRCEGCLTICDLSFLCLDVIGIPLLCDSYCEPYAYLVPPVLTLYGMLFTTLWCCCGPQKTANEFEDSARFLESANVLRFVQKNGQKGTVSATITEVQTHIAELGPYLLVGILLLFALVWWYFKNKKKSRKFNPNTNMFVVDQDFTRRGDAIPREFYDQSTDSTPKAGRMYMNPNLAAWENDDGTGHVFGSGSEAGRECYSDLEQESVVYEVERTTAL